MCVTQVGRVTATDGRVAAVEVGGRERRVPLVALGDEAATVTLGDWLVLQTGLAVRRLDGDDAAAVLADLGAAGARPAVDGDRPADAGAPRAVDGTDEADQTPGGVS